MAGDQEAERAADQDDDGETPVDGKSPKTVSIRVGQHEHEGISIASVAYHVNTGDLAVAAATHAGKTQREHADFAHGGRCPTMGALDAAVIEEVCHYGFALLQVGKILGKSGLAGALDHLD